MTDSLDDKPLAAPEVEDETDSGGGIEAPSVGRRLRAAREAANLSVADVAHSLKFSPRQIELLEADDYAALHGNLVVRGFTRSYARLLRLDADALLHDLDARTPSAPADVRPPENMGVASVPGGLRQLTPVVSVAVVLALTALLLGLWHFFGPKAMPSAVSQNHESRAPVAAQVVPPEVRPAHAEDADVAPVASVAPAAVGTASVAASVGPALFFEFADRSWLEVTDGRKQTLHTGESPAGSQLTLSGQPPFDIVIGNAGKVKLTYGDRVVDLAPYTRAEVARLKLE